MSHTHAAERIEARYGVPLAEVSTGILAAIAAGPSCHAALLELQPGARERWLVSTGHQIFHVVIARRRLCLRFVTFLPLNARVRGPPERFSYADPNPQNHESSET